MQTINSNCIKIKDNANYPFELEFPFDTPRSIFVKLGQSDARASIHQSCSVFKRLNPAVHHFGIVL